jgi:hypothetical protein
MQQYGGNKIMQTVITSKGYRFGNIPRTTIFQPNFRHFRDPAMSWTEKEMDAGRQDASKLWPSAVETK